MADLEVRTTGMGRRVSQGTAELWAALRAKGWTQGDLARELGCKSSLVNRWLHGHRSVSLAWALKIERLIGVSCETWTQPPAEPFRLKRTG